MALEPGFQAVERRCRVHGRHMEASNERGVVGRRGYLEQGGRLQNEMTVDDADRGPGTPCRQWDRPGRRGGRGEDPWLALGLFRPSDCFGGHQPPVWLPAFDLHPPAGGGQPQPPQLQQHRGQTSLFKFQGTMNAADSTLELCMAHGCREASGLHCCIEGGGYAPSGVGSSKGTTLLCSKSPLIIYQVQLHVINEKRPYRMGSSSLVESGSGPIRQRHVISQNPGGQTLPGEHHEPTNQKPAGTGEQGVGRGRPRWP